MSTSRPFSYYNGYTPLNTDKYGNILVGLTGVSLTDGGLSWFNGPDEDLGYVIAHDGGTNRTYGNNFGPIIGTSVGFWRSVDKTDNSFLNIAANVGQTFSSASNAKTWLESNGHWTSYVSIALEVLSSTYSLFLVGGFESFGETYSKDYSIIRIDTDGSKDTSFNNQNKFAISSDFRLSKQTPDGYILTVSTDPVTHEGVSNRVHLIDSNGNRVNSSNVYDSSQLTIDILAGMNDIVWDKSVGGTHSGKFYVGFSDQNVVAGGHTVSRIARYNSDYTIDKTFNTYVSSTQSGFSGQVNAIKILSDGNILVVGQFTQYKGVTLTSINICKLDPDGNRISAFNTGGSGPGSGVNAIRCVDEDSSGNIYIGGAWTGFNGTINTSISRIVKLNPSGSRNSSFNNISTAGTVVQIIVDPNDGNIFALNTSPNNTSKGIAKLLSSTGALSGSWVTGYDFDTSASTKMVFASASNSLYLFGTFNSYIDKLYSGMLKLNGTTGLANGTFSTDCRFRSGASPKDCFIDSNGKIVLVGTFTNFKSRNFASVKVSPNGSVDNTLNSYPSSAQLPTGVIPDGKGNYFIWPITISGWEKTFYTNGGSSNYDAIPNTGYASGVIKISSTGSFDSSYVPRINNQSGTVYAADLDSVRYQLYIGGNFTRTAHGSINFGTLIPKICRVSATSGVIDSSFVTGTGFRSSATSLQDGQNSSPYVYAVKYDPTINKVYCGGSFGGYNGATASKIIRLNSNGSYDQTFQVYNSSTQSGFNNTVWDIQVDRTGGAHDGKIYCGGDFTSYKGVTQGRIARLNTDGSLDTTFSTGTGFSIKVEKIIVLPDGKIFVLSGSSYNGSVISYVCRLNTDGTLDTTFNTGVGFQFTGLSATVTTYTSNPTIINIKYDPSGKLYVIGSFGKYRGEAKNCIVRINMDGTIDNTFNDNGYATQNSIYDLALS